MTRSRGVLGAAALGLLVVASGCARQGSPTGGPQDRRPPVVVSVEPDTFAVVRPGLDRLRVRFNERISEQAGAGGLAGAVLVSPEVAGVEVGHERSGLEIRIPGGLRPNRVYTIRILPVIQDMFGNPMAVPFEWAVSTGAPFTRNAVVGEVWDRATGDALDGIRVEFLPAGEDTLQHVAVSGSQGLYALRILPEGPFRLRAFQDRNQDRVLDPSEPAGFLSDSLGPADTLFLSLPILLPDTTAAVLAQAEALDSTVVRLLFDDNLDPTVPVEEMLVTLQPAPDSLLPEAADTVTVGPLPGVERVFHAFQWVAFRDSARAAADSALTAAVEAALTAGDTARADSISQEGPAPIPGGSGAAAQRGPGQGGAAAGERLPDGTPVPQPWVVVLLDGPLPPGVPVQVVLSGAVNLNGLPGGGGEVTAVWTPAPPDTTAADSLALPDSLAVPDTGAAPPDTGRVGLPGADRRR